MKKILNFFFGLILLTLTQYSAQSQHGLKAEYYDGVNFDRLVAVKFVANINESWNNKPPVPGIDPHSCSIRWSAKLKPEKSGNYKFSARVDDGIRVWIDNRLIIDQWELNDVGVFQSAADLVADQEYDIQVEYFNALIEGEVRLLWKIPRTKKEHSWFEYFFGEDKSHSVIAPKYFFRPDETDQIKDDSDFTNNSNKPNPSLLDKPEISKPKNTNSVNENLKNNPSLKETKRQKPKTSTVKVTAKEADNFIPKNIGFEKSKVNILESSIKELNLFAQFMLDHPQLTVMIEGHTDPVGDSELNLQLSKQRAYKIANYLVGKGVDKERIKAEGFGGSKPLVVPKEGSYYPANRRVVFVLGGLE